MNFGKKDSSRTGEAPSIARSPFAFLRQTLLEAAPKRIVAMTLFVATASVLETMTPLALREVINGLDKPDYDGALSSFIFLLCLSAGTMIFYRAFQWVEMSAGPNIRAHAQKSQIAYLLSHTPASFNSMQSGTLVEAIKRSSMNVVTLAQIATFEFTNMLVVIVNICIVITLEDYFFLMLMSIWIVLYFSATIFFAFRCLTLGRALFQSSGASAGQINDVLRNYETVFNFGAQQQENENLGKYLDVEKQRAMELRRYIFFMRVFGNIAIFTLFSIMTAIAFNDVLNDSRTVGGFALVFTATNILIMTVIDLSRQLINVFENIGSLDGGLDILLQEQAPASELSASTNLAPAQAQSDLNPEMLIEVRNLTFAYPGRAPIFEDFNLTLKKGSKLGLVGPSGAGKTTLIRLLLGHLQPNAGSILINGRDIRDYHPEELRKQYAVVSQSTSIFNRSVRENISYGEVDIEDGRILSAVKMADAEDIVMGHPDGLDAIVGENGSQFSGGEIQRLNIARSLVRAGDPILVFDEATSALDTATEDRIQSAIENAIVDRAVIAIAHRVSTVKMLDHIVYLDEGKIVESGNHQQLIDIQGKYADVWDRQSHLSLRMEA